MIEVRKILVSNLREVVFFRRENMCVGQVVKELPPLPLICQACTHFFYRVKAGKSKLRDPSLEFLLLLSSSRQVSEALSRLSVKEGDTAYSIVCCEDLSDTIRVEGIEVHPLIRDNRERVMLTRNSLISAGSF
jgi:tRNA threonylcarbamoyladenosine modification (KEOPS) complex Cgi121 subunit